MSILVTGGAGYIGSHMAYGLIDANEPVVVLDDLSTGLEWCIPNQATFIRGDIGDKYLVSNIIKQNNVDAILHFAASVIVPKSIIDPLKYYRNNAIKSYELIECAVRNGIRHFIFSSTSAVYSEAAPVPLTEDAATEPTSPYGWTKLMTEQLLRDVARASDLHYVILRYFNACGADPKLRTGQSTPAATHLIKVGVETALGRRPEMEVFGTNYPTPDGTCIRDYIHVCDLVAAHLLALQYLRSNGASEIFNCGYGHGHSVLEVIQAIKRIANKDFKVKFGPRRGGDKAIGVASADRLRSMLGWKPQFDNLDTIIKHALAWECRLMERSSGAVSTIS
jgi:UDP-glucose 4-epimerase